ncbi:MAG TPA: hypothetical protein VLL05_04290, partial [Terriglobales bacterium]|nr:hypothetical protein [Terriglobales bacterium]
MQVIWKKATAMLGLLLFGAVLVSQANAECGNLGARNGANLKPQAWLGQSPSASLLLVSEDSVDPIVGFWNVTFTARGNADIPDGAPIDHAYAQWHSDGT